MEAHGSKAAQQQSCKANQRSMMAASSMLKAFQMKNEQDFVLKRHSLTLSLGSLER